MFGNQVFTDPVDATYTTEAYKLGTLRPELPSEVNANDSTHYGPRVWRFVHNDESSTAFAKGDLILMADGSGSAGYAWGEGIVCSAAAVVKHRIMGVAQHAIAAGSYGWVVCYGICEAQGDGSVAQGDPIVSHTSGQVDTMADGEEEGVFGVALEADGSAGDDFTVYVNVL